MALVALGSLAVYAVLRICFYAPLYKRGEDVVRAEANYMTHLIESIRSVQAIKLFNAEGPRQSQSSPAWPTRSTAAPASSA